MQARPAPPKREATLAPGRRRLVLLLAASLCVGGAGCGQAESPPEPEIPGLVERLWGSDPEDVNAAARRLVEIGAPALEALKLPPSEPDFHRSTAIEVMGWMGAAAEPAVPWLVDLLRTDLRSTVSRTLGEIGRAAVPPMLALLASSPHAELRRVACATLGLTRLRDDDIRRALLARLADDPERTVRDEAASALGAISFRDDETLRALERTADTNALNAQFYATYALAHMGSEGMEVLLRLARSPHEGARASALGSLGSAKQAPAEPRVDALLAALTDSSTWVRGNAASSLGDIGRPSLRTLSSLRILVAALGTQGDEVATSKAQEAVHRLEALERAPPSVDGVEVKLPSTPR